MLKYSIVTINYKTAHRVGALYDSLVTFLDPDSYEFIVLDNNSGAEEINILNKKFDQNKNVHLISMQKNLGFGGGYGEAVRFAQGEFLVLINPDVVLKSDILETLETVIEQEAKAGIVAPQLENPDGSLQGNARQFPNVFNLLGRRLGKGHQLLPAGPVPWVQGSFMMMRRRFFIDILQGFDPRFFLFFEDTDLCRRTWLAGFKVILLDEVRAIHGSERLSGSGFAILRKTFWIHIGSALKYFGKYKHTKPPIIWKFSIPTPTSTFQLLLII